jgi:hypothetical protein
MKSILLLLWVLWSCTPSLTDQNVPAQPDQIQQDLAYFKDGLATALKPNFRKNDLNQIKNPALKALAQQLLDKKYDLNYRVQTFEALLKPSTLGKDLLIGNGYSRYENMTGIFLPKGQHIVLVEGIASHIQAKLLLPNWERRAPQGVDPDKDPSGWGIQVEAIPLKNGINIIDVSKFDALAYIEYFSDEPQKEQSLQVHFVNAQVNGIFDSAKHSDADWNALLENAVYPIIDGKGKHIQIAYPVEACKTYAWGKGLELLNNYDSLVYRQHRLMGLEKYNKVPKNRILSRVNYNYYMFRDGDGVAYMGTTPGNAMPLVVDPARVIKGDPCWGFSHEVGHVHQLRPQFNWGGLGEVSNNVFSLYVTTSFGNKSRISEQGNYDKAKTSIIDQKISYLQDDDVFNRLVPFWQLQLYFAGQGQQPDFYPDLFEAFRQQAAGNNSGSDDWGARGRNPAPYQLNFIKTACEISKTDLTEFFEAYGFFHVGEFQMEDYGRYTYAMTQEMVDACKASIKAMQLPKPKVDLTLLKD